MRIKLFTKYTSMCVLGTYHWNIGPIYLSFSTYTFKLFWVVDSCYQILRKNPSDFFLHFLQFFFFHLFLFIYIFIVCLAGQNCTISFFTPPLRSTKVKGKSQIYSKRESQNNLRSNWRKTSNVNKNKEDQVYLNICLKQFILKLLTVWNIFQYFFL